MGKRYHCEYCDRSFVDEPESRRKHLQGISHIRSRNNHYKKYRDLKNIYLEENSKEECRRFRNTGNCQFNENCNYTHYSKEDLIAIKNIIEEQEKKSLAHIVDASLDEWLNKRKLKNNTGILEIKSKQSDSGQSSASYNSSLPISMQSMKEEDVLDVEFTEWG
uniref:C3H1-type domain-containing protein n=1 Tax=Graphocephala atropunctata TaxID=36148 RepID=A0A1B6KQV1_9HEMI